jgi:hypothetical protein
MFQNLKFKIIALLLNDEQRANLASVLLLSDCENKTLTRIELLNLVVSKGLVHQDKLSSMLHNAAAFGTDDSEFYKK